MNKFAYASVALALHVAAASATEIIYTPVNPSFGGNPLNGPLLLNIANTINKYRDPALQDALNRLANKTPLERFNERLQQSILDRISGSVVSGTPQEGTFDAGSFLVTVATLADGLVVITTTEKATGATTQFQIPPL